MAHRLRNHHAQLLGHRKIWPKRPLRAPKPDFLGFLALRLRGIGPTAGARANRYFRHNSGPTAQNPDFFGSSVAETPRATFRSPENLPETASTGPQIRFFGIFGRCGVPEKTQVPRTPKTPKNAKKSKFRQNEAVSSKILSEDPMTNVLRLTREQKNFRFWIDGPEIWPG